MRFISFILILVALIVIYKIAQSLSPNKPIEYTIITALLALSVWLGKMVFTLKAEEGSLKSQIDSLKEEKSSLKQKISNLEEEIVTLKSKSLKQVLQFDKKLHCYKDEAGHLYCPPCYDDKNKAIHLKPCADSNYGWECSACHNIVKNPDYRTPLLPRSSDID